MKIQKYLFNCKLTLWLTPSSEKPNHFKVDSLDIGKTSFCISPRSRISYKTYPKFCEPIVINIITYKLINVIIIYYNLRNSRVEPISTFISNTQMISYQEQIIICYHTNDGRKRKYVILRTENREESYIISGSCNGYCLVT